MKECLKDSKTLPSCKNSTFMTVSESVPYLDRQIHELVHVPLPHQEHHNSLTWKEDLNVMPHPHQLNI